MKKTYLFILDEGKRVATFLLGIHGKTIEALIAKAEAEYPGKTYLQGDDSFFNEFAAGKIYVDGQFIDPPPYVPPLEDVKAAKIAELKGIRDEKEVEPVQYIDHYYDFDVKSFDRINAAIIALDQTHGTIGWTTADNSVVEVNADSLRGVIASAALRSNTLHIIYRELKEAVNAATTAEEVESINWPED